MPYFTKDFIDFFKELEKNNSKVWFDENRKRYETSVKKPFYAFTDEMIGRINANDPDVNIMAKDAVMRVNRDIRFSKDKTPYNTTYGAMISKSGRKDKSDPGIYIQFSAKKIALYGGCYMPDKDGLLNIRNTIAQDPKAFTALVNHKKFKEVYGEILGDKHKRIPKEFVETAEKVPLIANKQFYYGTDLDSKLITDDSLPEKIMDCWKAAEPMMNFLKKALKG